MKLSYDQINALIKTYSKWHLVDGKLVKEADFGGFSSAMQYVNKIAGIASSLNHHPDILIRHSRVRLELYSHDIGGITDQDQVFIEKLETNS